MYGYESLVWISITLERVIGLTMICNNILFSQGFVAFESIIQPGHYIRHQGYRLKVDNQEQEEKFKNEASFEIVKHPIGKYCIFFKP